MKTTLSTSEAIDILRSDEYANWTYNGAKALVEWLERYEDETGCEFDFCRVTLRCDFSEYRSLFEWATDYFGSGNWQASVDCEDYVIDETERDSRLREYIQNRGQLIEFDGGIIVSEF
jgi:hypothetical protein